MTRSIGQLAPVRWNVGVPALIGFVPLALFSIAYPPSSEPWWEHPESMLPVVLCVVGGVATGLLGLRHDTRLRHVAWTFWFTQGAGRSLLSADPTSPGGLVGTFLVAAMLTLALGVLPMTVTFALCAVVRSSARQPPPTVLGPDARSVLDRGLCSRCGKPLDPSSWGQCLQCGASQDVSSGAGDATGPARRPTGRSALGSERGARHARAESREAVTRLVPSMARARPAQPGPPRFPPP